MNTMIQLIVWRFIKCTRRSNGKPQNADAPWPTALAVEGRSERCGAYATAKPKKTVRSFEDTHFPHSG
jgi:hypothetical protein